MLAERFKGVGGSVGQLRRSQLPRVRHAPRESSKPMPMEASTRNTSVTAPRRLVCWLCAAPLCTERSFSSCRCGRSLCQCLRWIRALATRSRARSRSFSLPPCLLFRGSSVHRCKAPAANPSFVGGISRYWCHRIIWLLAILPPSHGGEACHTLH